MNLRNTILTIVLLLFSFSISAQWNTHNMLRSGMNAIYFDDYIHAIDNFNSIIRVKPYLPEPYFFRALAKMNLDDFDGAIKDYSQALEINPNYFHAYMYRAIAYHYLHKYDLAMKDYNEAISIDPSDAYVYANRGMTKAATGDIKGAEQDYSKSLLLNKDIIAAYLNRAIMREKLDDIDGAFTDCNAAIKLDMFSDKAYGLRGYLWYKQKNYHNAIEDYNRAIKANPKNIDILMNRALTWYEMKEYQHTLDDYSEIIEIDSNYIYAYYNRAMLRAQIGDYNNAISDLDKAVDMNSDNILIYFNRGLLRMEIRDFTGAYNDFSESIRLYPDFVKAYMARAAVNNEMKNYAAADKDAYQAHTIMDRYKKMKAGDKNALVDTTENFRRLVDFNAKNDRIRDVINGRVQDKNVIVSLQDIFVAQYMNLDIKNKIQHYSRHVMEYNQRTNYASSLTVSNYNVTINDSIYQHHLMLYNSAIMENPSVENYMLRGILFMDRLEYPSAIADFNAILKTEPDNILALFNRANARKKMFDYIESFDDKTNRFIGEKENERFTDYREVMNDYNHCLKLDPTFVYALFNIGNIYVKNREIDKAIETYTKVLDIDPDFAEAYFNRGLLHIYNGQKEKAGADLSKAGEKGITDAYNILKRYCKETEE